MRLVRYETEDGWKFQSWIPEHLPASEAEKGIPHNPPDTTRIDWSEVERELNNLLIDRDIITLKDVNDNSGVLGNTILSIIQPRLIELYKENPGYKKSFNGKLNSPNKEAR